MAERTPERKSAKATRCMKVVYSPTADMVAGILTKSLARVQVVDIEEATKDKNKTILSAKTATAVKIELSCQARFLCDP